MIIHSKAPASLMLLGEYSILDNHIALGFTSPSYVTLKLGKSANKRLDIKSSLGQITRASNFKASNYKTSSLNYAIYLLEEFYLATAKNLTHCKNLNIAIESSIPTNVGLGSSAALLAVLITGLDKFYNTNLDK